MTRLVSITIALGLGLGLALATAACGKSDSKGGGKGSGGGGGEIPADHVAAVNAAVPAELKGKLEFEAGRVGESKRDSVFKAAVPRGWKQGGVIPGTLRPPDADDFGSSKTFGRSLMRIGSNCDGTCEKKDWAAVSDKVLYKQFTSGQVEGKVLKDDKRPNGRTLVFEHTAAISPETDIAIYIHTSWWEPEGTEYYTCSAELGTPAKGAADAFEKACAKVIKE
jgi:hypothetical protein